MKNAAAFEKLIRKINPKLKAITHRLNGRFTFFNDQDLYQEALLHLWLDYKADKLFDKTDSYILQGCYFYLQNYIRTVQDKRKIFSLDAIIGEDDATLEEILPAQDIEPYFDYLNSKIFVEKMQNNGLTMQEKKVLSFYLEGLTVREIGKRMNISHVRVIKLKNKIRQRYEKFLRE